MGWTFWCWVLLVLAQIQVFGCFGCLEEERIALLELKATINQPYGSLASWDSELSDCCLWDFVECSNATGRVIKLDLLYKRPKGLGEWYLNSTLFLPFEELRSLDLTGNQLVGWIENEDLEKLSRLRRLEDLDLSWNKFNTSILSALGALASLKSLSLRGNRLEGPAPAQELEALNKLEVLDLSYSSLHSSFLQNVGVMTSLKALRLNDNRLDGTLPVKGLCQLKNLQELDLSENGFEGILPSCLGNLTSLRVLDLSFNEFAGNIVSRIITNLTSLEYLSISNCHFQGSFSFSSLANHSKLEVLESNNISMVETEFPRWVPAFQLKYLHLSHCKFNKLIGSIPNFLHYQYDLRLLDLSHNNLEKFPTGLLENNTRLEVVNLKNNSFRGHFHLPSHPNKFTSVLDVSNNHFDGLIPTNISSVLPILQLLDMSTNGFQGMIPFSVGDMRRLKHLDLSDNNLSGEIPTDLATRCSSLTVLMVSNNNLQGQILPTFSNLTELLLLQLDGNSFTGNIPHCLSNSSKLGMLDVSNNSLSGRLPGWMGNMSNLLALTMHKNKFEGPIPIEFCAFGSLQYLDLSENNVNGTMPSCFNPPEIRHVHLQKNGLTGPLTDAFSKSSSLVTLDIAYNHFTGSIPNWVGELSFLSILVLKGNDFEGNIPIQLCQLSKLCIMDLSHNNLSGLIPHCLNDFSFKGIEDTSFAFPIEKLVSSNLMTSLYSYESTLINPLFYWEEFKAIISSDFTDQEHVEFTTKNRPDTYKGVVLNLMYGIDLSCNKLIGDIPPEIGTVGYFRALNLSHNYLTGPIPITFSKLKQIESLDLSYNSLTGTIPSQLTELTSLEVFTVAYNNLSGRTPDNKGQFATFTRNSYEGNPLLCGEPLEKKCSNTIEAPSLAPEDFNKEDGFGDMITFYISFAVSYLTVLLGFIAVLYINPYWRQMWFFLIDMFIISSYYFVLDNLLRLYSFINA